MTPAIFFLGFFAAGLVLDDCGSELAADVRLAMKRADLTLDYVSRVLRVPPNKLSDQLNGKRPFTFFWRFFSSAELRAETDFRSEFLDILARRIDRIVLPRGVTVVSVSAAKKRMAKAALPQTRSVTLPLTAEPTPAPRTIVQPRRAVAL